MNLTIILALQSCYELCFSSHSFQRFSKYIVANSTQTSSQMQISIWAVPYVTLRGSIKSYESMSLEVRLQMSEQMDKMTKLHINVERNAQENKQKMALPEITIKSPQVSKDPSSFSHIHSCKCSLCPVLHDDLPRSPILSMSDIQQPLLRYGYYILCLPDWFHTSHSGDSCDPI